MVASQQEDSALTVYSAVIKNYTAEFSWELALFSSPNFMLLNRYSPNTLKYSRNGKCYGAFTICTLLDCFFWNLKIALVQLKNDKSRTPKMDI